MKTRDEMRKRQSELSKLLVYRGRPVPDHQPTPARYFDRLNSYFCPHFNLLIKITTINAILVRLETLVYLFTLMTSGQLARHLLHSISTPAFYNPTYPQSNT